MKYYKYRDPDDVVGMDNPVTYIETEDGGAIRQITTNGTTFIASNVVQPDGGMYLADKVIDYESLGDEVTPITKQEFEAVWQAHATLRQNEWNNAKQIYSLGMAIHGYLEIFYPQGVIVNLGNNVLGVADYNACRASTEPQFMNTRQKITATVTGYDEENQWVILGSPQVHPEREE